MTTYRVKVVVNKTYEVFVKIPDGTDKKVAEDYIWQKVEDDEGFPEYSTSATLWDSEVQDVHAVYTTESWANDSVYNLTGEKTK